MKGRQDQRPHRKELACVQRKQHANLSGISAVSRRRASALSHALALCRLSAACGWCLVLLPPCLLAQAHTRTAHSALPSISHFRTQSCITKQHRSIASSHHHVLRLLQNFPPPILPILRVAGGSERPRLDRLDGLPRLSLAFSTVWHSGVCAWYFRVQGFCFC
jgi:hypothetical protein